VTNSTQTQFNLTAPISFGKAIAVVGSRDYPRLEHVTDFVKTLPLGTIVVTGGARGVDTAAERAAQLARLNVKLFAVEPFEWNVGKFMGPFRNELIVRYVMRLGGSVVIFGCVNGGKLTPGSESTRQLCRQLGCPVLVYDQNGEVLA
jgi:hypothetical protein